MWAFTFTAWGVHFCLIMWVPQSLSVFGAPPSRSPGTFHSHAHTKTSRHLTHRVQVPPEDVLEVGLYFQRIVFEAKGYPQDGPEPLGLDLIRQRDLYTAYKWS